ncbi:MFS transporter [Paraburkholderia silviterrae]|uniref:MFS transporter n=1 Tax=Paraburkholderia silviterrae TaxID=2528715 RepID=A0A4R5LYA4_9BURK|nr:MFS transporter [Paraburkholderia silviterrae]TDG17353.1 MFS transporter [Paraburkholderia silviterrae]
MKSTSISTAAPGTLAAPTAISTRGLIVATTIGNAFEFFDLTVYSFFAVLLGKLFFPLASAQQQLLLSVGTFGVGFVARPLGGVMFGLLADRFGRVVAMNLTLLTMALGTALIGLTPTYASIGIAAPILVLAARLLQGFSAGGEVGVATTLLAERASASRRGFITSWQFASQGAAALAGSFVGFLLSHFLDTAALESWGWRLPFLAGVLIAPLGLYLRARIGHEESGANVHARAGHGAHKQQGVLRTVLTRDAMQLLFALMLVIGGTSARFIVLYYMSTYAIKFLHLPMDTAMWCGILSGAVMLVVSPIGGLMSDRFGRKRVTGYSRAALTLLILPGFLAISHAGSVATLYLVVCALAALHSINAGATGPLLPELFPRSTRATGLSLSYAAGVSIFGGFAQFFVTWLIGATGNPNAPAWYVIVCGVISLVPLAFIADRTREEI